MRRHPTTSTLRSGPSEIPARLPKRGECNHFLSLKNWTWEDAGDRQTGWMNRCACGVETVVIL